MEGGDETTRIQQLTWQQLRHMKLLQHETEERNSEGVKTGAKK